MWTNSQLEAQVSQRLLDELTSAGTRDLTEMRLSDLEREVYELSDRISQRVLRGVLEDQAQQVEAQLCPRCQRPLEDRPPKERAIQTARCEVQWSQPVQHCSRCRCDFFPSGGGDGRFGGTVL
jgi:hypothetical protein